LSHAITFDFHDTLVHCDEWFQLEVRHFPSAFLTWHNQHAGFLAAPQIGAELDRAYRRLRLAIIQHGHELSAERSIAVVLDQAGLTVDDELISSGVEHLMRSALADAHAVPGAQTTIMELSNRGLALGVVSSAVHHPFLEWSLQKLGMLDAFQVVTTSASCGYYKSRPEIYWHTLKVLGADATGSIHVGDSARFDVDGAGQAGMRTVWLKRGTPAPPERVPDLTVATLEGAAQEIIELSSRQRA